MPRIRNNEDFCNHTKSRLLKILNENIRPFWYPKTLDYEDGGYYLNHDINGKPIGGGTKMIVTQARMVWYFSHLFNSGYGGMEELEAAKHGYRFLRDYMWDRENGGFFWEVDSKGRVLRPDKIIYGQAFGLYALSEFFIASKDKEVLDMSSRLFNLIEEHSHDKSYGGYKEHFFRDWSPISLTEKKRFYFSPNLKSMNTHLHMLEALTTFYKATGEALAKDRLYELILVLSNSVFRKKVGACAETHLQNWKPLHRPQYDRISYGHNLENIWLLAKACDTLGIPDGLLLDFYETVFSYSVKYGFDNKKGGFYESGPAGKPADKRDKVWWIQAEALVCEAYMYYLTGDTSYLKYLEKTLDWIEKYQVDWKNGDWYSVVKPNGKPFGNKAGIWKAAYHNGRAMIEILNLLEEIKKKHK
ncbi:MAG: AGE family epimerase/isomerase [Thermoproteota archaeon]